MPEDYEVQPGDCMSSIAYEHGFFWETLWNLSENADLRAARKDPNVLMKGDMVHIPDLTVKQESRPTDQRHKFMLKGAPEKLRVRLLDIHQKPRANLDYIIVIDGNMRKGRTDRNGELKESIPPNAKTGRLILQTPPGKDGKPISGKPATETIDLQLGDLDPVTEVSGAQARLSNLGFYTGSIDGNLDDATKGAISAFQTKQGLPVTGALDDATQGKLQSLHGH
jgi:N-acetylmuramoyl-L-alanine amidase